MSCEDFFREHSDDLEKCKALQDLPLGDVLAWESESASPYSPGPVTDDETLVRQILSPVHWDESDNSLKPTAFDDASNKGLSVNRLKAIGAKELEARAERRVAEHNEANQLLGRQRSFKCLLHLNCGEVRAIAANDESERRAFAVYDTASQEDPSHADICQIVKTRAEGRSARASLRDLANGFLKRMTEQ
jgi:hypothetical protein